MWIVIELLILTILFLILIIIFIDEKRFRSAVSSSAKMTGYWDGTEKRRHIRKDVLLNITYSIRKRPHIKKNSLSKNISSGGIMIQASEKLLPPILLLLEINLPNDSKPITADGEVIWVKEYSRLDERGRRLFNTGIKFVSMSPKDRERLDGFIKNLS